MFLFSVLSVLLLLQIDPKPAKPAGPVFFTRPPSHLASFDLVSTTCLLIDHSLPGLQGSVAAPGPYRGSRAKSLENYHGASVLLVRSLLLAPPNRPRARRGPNNEETQLTSGQTPSQNPPKDEMDDQGPMLRRCSKLRPCCPCLYSASKGKKN